MEFLSFIKGTLFLRPHFYGSIKKNTPGSLLGHLLGSVIPVLYYLNGEDASNAQSLVTVVGYDGGAGVGGL